MSLPRLRLAPSPTGFLHLGNFRTALFGYLLAKKLGGVFILRIEDTDEKREVAGAVDSLMAVFKAMGIAFDEGPGIGGDYGPYIQSQRLDIYRAHAHQLVESGHAYYCFSTPEELDTERQRQAANHEAPRYNRAYRDYPIEEAKKRIAAGEKYVIRQKMPLEGEVIVRDELRGEIVFPAKELEDHVLLKSDGGATYQLASVIDDHLMKISHVTRGDEWIPSLPKNVLLYQAFGWELPAFIHLPLILNKTGGKLSKRQGDVFVEDYLGKGYLKEALINFCALLGWHPKGDQELFTLKELESIFTLEGIGTSPAVFDIEKLDSINGHYIRSLSVDELLLAAKPFFVSLLASASPRKQDETFLKNVLALEQARLKYLSELPELTSFFFADKLEYEAELLIWKKMTLQAVGANLSELSAMLENISETDWNKEHIESVVVTALKAAGKSLGDYLWPLRVALSGQKASPSPFEIASVLGKEETLAKIKHATGLVS